MDIEYGLAYREMYERHWWFRSREDFLLRYLRENKLGCRGNALDVGCGDGLFLDRLSELGCRPAGLEVDARLVSAETHKKHKIHIGYLDSNFQPEEKFDLILMLDVLEHIENDVEALQHVRRCLAPDGVLVITVPAFTWLWTHHDDVNHHFRRYTNKSLNRSIGAAGLNMNVSRYFYSWLIPLKLIVQWKEKLLGVSKATPKIPGKQMNKLFEGIAKLEQNLTRRLPVPAGSSLFAVCTTSNQPMR